MTATAIDRTTAAGWSFGRFGLPDRPGSLQTLARPWTDRLDLLLLMTLLLLLLYSTELWYVRIPLRLLILPALFLPRARRSPLYWFFTAGLVIAGTCEAWYSADNHKFLMGYWCLAVAIALGRERPAETLRSSARGLLVLTFAFALFWKLVAPDFRDGSFFEYALVSDQRFQPLARVLGGATAEDWSFNRTAYQALTNYDSGLTEVTLRSSGRITVVARLATWWTLAIEALILLAFAAPDRWPAARARHLLLLTFVVSTYAVAPVLGFGWLLLTMGLAQAAAASRPTVALYVVIFVLLQAVPVLGLLGQG